MNLKLNLLIAASLAVLATGRAQSNVDAWYAQGQVWVVWDVEPAVLTNCVPTLTPALSNGVPIVVSNCLPQTYAIYSSELPITNTANATLVGRLFAEEWSASILRSDLKASFGADPGGFTIPDGLGGTLTLATNQGVFVHTVRSNFTSYYAVRPFGETNVPPDWQAGPVTATYSLASDHAPTAHLQARGPNRGHPIEWWTLWADGDLDHTSGRPDFPIMENDHRRGAPHNFMVMEPASGGLPTTNVPLTVAVHSGDAQAKMWLPGSSGFKSIGLEPVGGLLVAIEERAFLTVNGWTDARSLLNTGYVPSFDPFRDANFAPGIEPGPAHNPPADAIIHPYQVWRFNWILDWLYANKAVDSNRVSVAAHSGGAKGTLLWTHASPERFAAVNLYAPALGDFPDRDARFIGTREQNLPLLLTNRQGRLARAQDLHQLTASFSPQRDMPFTRVFLGKREQNWVVDDNTNALGDIIEQYTQADALGIGVASFWDLRSHGVDKWTWNEVTNAIANPRNCGTNPTVNISGAWSIDDLWVPSLATQFRRDDATNQYRYRNDQSYPAFFNCAIRGGHENPGAVIYTNNTVPFDGLQLYDGLVTTTECRPPWTGDRRGTWGGYFDWETNIVDTPTNWSAVLFLVGPPSAFNPVEGSPNAMREADVAIRRPQLFRPAAGTFVAWELRNAANNALLLTGTNAVGPDDLVAIPNLPIPRDPLRVRLEVNSLVAPGTTNDCFPCTQVIGYSQVGAANGWFTHGGVFESIVGTDGWQLLWNNGATLEDWQDPNHPYWSNAIVSPCATNAAAPDRVLLNLASRTYDTNLTDWVNGINATIDTIVLKYPGVRQIILQPIVGGPSHQVCDIGGVDVRASVSHPIMDEAVALVVAARTGTQPEVVAGISPEVEDCADYNDTLGHFTPAGAVAAAQTIGDYYAALDAAWTSTPEPCPPPLLSIRLLSTPEVELSWEACTNVAYQVESTLNLTNWRDVGPVLAAPVGSGWLTSTVPLMFAKQFLRVRMMGLTNSPVPTTPGVYDNLAMTHAGYPRTYRLNIPPGYTGATSAPIALILHGGGQSADAFFSLHPDLSREAAARDMILVLPDALDLKGKTGWDSVDPGTLPDLPHADDVGYLLALIDRLSGSLNIDSRRIYAGGFSSGAIMTHFLGARTTNVFAALAMVEGAIGRDLDDDGMIETNPPAAGPMPVLLLNVTNSCTLPYYGGLNDDGRLIAPALDAAHYWTNANLCVTAPTLMTNTVVTNHVWRFNADCYGTYPPPAVTLTNQVIVQRWAGCTNNTEVVFITLTDGGHLWPDADDNVGFNANTRVLNFFLRHTRP